MKSIQTLKDLISEYKANSSGVKSDVVAEQLSLAVKEGQSDLAFLKGERYEFGTDFPEIGELESLLAEVSELLG